MDELNLFVSWMQVIFRIWNELYVHCFWFFRLDLRLHLYCLECCWTIYWCRLRDTVWVILKCIFLKLQALYCMCILPWTSIVASWVVSSVLALVWNLICKLCRRAWLFELNLGLMLEPRICLNWYLTAHLLAVWWCGDHDGDLKNNEETWS